MSAQQLGRGTSEELKGLLHEFWAEVARAGRRVQLHGPLTVSAFASAIAHELSLGPRDFPALHAILGACVASDGALVDLARLRAVVAEADAGPQADTEWQSRCGLLKPKPSAQQRDVAAGARRKYEIENHGSPYAIAGDAKATLKLLSRERSIKEERIRQAISEVTTQGGRLTRAALATAVRAHLDVADAEVDDLLLALDPRHTNLVSAELFFAQYLPELMKPKSLRRSVLPQLPPAHAPSATGGSPRSPRGSNGSSGGSGGNTARRSGSARASSGTRASQLRHTMGVSLRKFNETDGANWIMRRSASPRRALEAQQQSPRTSAKIAAAVAAATGSSLAGAIPRAPSRGTGNSPLHFRRVKTAIVPDPVQLGNIATTTAAA